MTRLTYGDRLTVESLTDEVWAFVFNLLDAEPHLDSDDVGRIAGAVTKVVRDDLTETLAVEG
jgi:hypothetical protein